MIGGQTTAIFVIRRRENLYKKTAGPYAVLIDHIESNCTKINRLGQPFDRRQIALEHGRL